MSEEATVTIPPVTIPAVTIPPAAAAPPPAPPAVTPEHISALHRHLDLLGHALKVGFEEVIAFVRKAAPAVEVGAAAVAAQVPVVGPVAAIVEAVAGKAAAVAACCEHADQPHGRNGCKAPGCSCSAAS